MKENKKGLLIGIILVLVVILAGFYIGYKLFLVTNYSVKTLNHSIVEIKDAYKIKDYITINTKDLDEKDYLKFKEIKMKNDFIDFIKEENDTSVVYTNKEKKARITIAINEPYLDFYYLVESNLEGTNVKNVKYQDRINYLKKNHITNDLELFNFLASDNYQKNIFTSIRDIKGSYATYLIAEIMVPQKLTGINGDLNGYIRERNINGNIIREVNILKNKKRYMFMFEGSFYTLDNIIDLISTIDVING